MRPIEVILPQGSLLDPHKDAAVVGMIAMLDENGENSRYSFRWKRLDQSAASGCYPSCVRCMRGITGKSLLVTQILRQRISTGLHE